MGVNEAMARCEPNQRQSTWTWQLWLDVNPISDSQPELGMEISLEKGEEISYEKREIDVKNSSN